MKISIRQNRYDNWYGYVGKRRVKAFADMPTQTAHQAALQWKRNVSLTIQQKVRNEIFRLLGV